MTNEQLRELLVAVASNNKKVACAIAHKMGFEPRMVAAAMRGSKGGSKLHVSSPHPTVAVAVVSYTDPDTGVEIRPYVRGAKLVSQDLRTPNGE